MAGPWEKYSAAKAVESDSKSGPWSKYQDTPKPKGPSESESGLRGGISGMVAGFDDEITGGLGAVGRVFGVKNLGSAKPFDPNSHYEMAHDPLSVDEIVKAYRENRDAARDEQKLDYETNPKSYIAGNIAGSIISPASKIALGGGSKLAQAVKTGAAQGAVFGAGTSDSDLTKGEVGKFTGDTMMGAGIGGAIPVALKGAGYVGGKALDASKVLGKKTFSSIVSIPEQNIDKYLANPERINGAKSVAEIKEIVDESVSKLRDAVDSGKLSELEAKDTVKGIKEQVTRGLSDKKVDAKDALRTSESLFKDAKERALTPLKEKLAPTDRAVDVASMVGELKQKVTDQSRQAMDTLKSGEKVDLSKVYNNIYDTVDRLKSAGTDEADSIAAKLNDYRIRLQSKNWANIDALEAKKLIQGLDEITTYSPMAGSFDQAKNKAFKGVRSALDQSLKEGSPEYLAAMQPVSKNAQLLEQSNALFGSPEVAVGRLGRLNTARGQFDRATLGELEQAVGKVGYVTKDADVYAQAQRILKDPKAVQKIEQSLPEYQTLRQSMADVARRNPKWTRTQIEQATAKQRQALAEATSKRVFAENSLEPFKALTPATTENKINSLMRGDSKGINNREVFDRLGKKTGNDFGQMTDDLAVKNSFEKSVINGSRNTVLGAVVGYAFGGIYGAGAGAAIGRTVLDNYGPKTGKIVLDGIIKLRKNPSIQTIRSLSIPESLKQELEREFKVFMISKNGVENRGMGRVAENDGKANRSPSDLRGEDKWAASGLMKLGIEDQSMSDQLLNSKEGKRLLIEASDLPANSKRLEAIKLKLSQGLEK